MDPRCESRVNDVGVRARPEAGGIATFAASLGRAREGEAPSTTSSRNENTMYIGSGILVTVLIVLAIIFFAKRV